MMTVAKFEKVSFKQYKADVMKMRSYLLADVPDSVLYDEWQAIKLPTRATTGSAGYDFYMPFDWSLSQVSEIIPTGIRCNIQPGWFLALMPKSGLGFKYGFNLRNTVGVVDEDFYGADNEGHIMVRCAIDFDNGIALDLKAGQKFVQGIFLPYGIAEDDTANGKRVGGFGSTGA